MIVNAFQIVDRNILNFGAKEGNYFKGVVKVYDVNTGKLEDEIKVVDGGGDAVNGVSFIPHPFGKNDGDGLLAVAVGSRHFHEEDLSDNETESESIGRNPGFLQLYEIKR